MIAFALPLAILLGLAGGSPLTWRQRRLSRVLVWALAVGTTLCSAVVLLGMTPFGQAMRTWWLD
jgi:hypothetical protein